jgi:hypothetical protein
VRQFVGAWARQRPLKKKIEMNSWRRVLST